MMRKKNKKKEEEEEGRKKEKREKKFSKYKKLKMKNNRQTDKEFQGWLISYLPKYPPESVLLSFCFCSR